MAEPPIQLRVAPEVRAAYEAAAAKAGMSLGRWIQDAATAALPKSVQKALPEPRTPGRPKKQVGDQ